MAAALARDDALAAKEEEAMQILEAESDEEMSPSPKQKQPSSRRLMLGLSAAFLISVVVVGVCMQSTTPAAEVQQSPVHDAIQMNLQTKACNAMTSSFQDDMNKKLEDMKEEIDIDQTIFDNHLGPEIPLGLCHAQYNVQLYASKLTGIGDTVIKELECLDMSGKINKEVNLTAKVKTSPGISGHGKRMAKCGFLSTAKVKFTYDISFTGLSVSTKVDVQTKGANLKYAQVHDFKVRWKSAQFDCSSTSDLGFDLCKHAATAFNKFPAQATLERLVSWKLEDEINYKLAEIV